ncbi:MULTISPECIES: hypothetical protein [unclassified Pseudodesulfovibrio]|uniref:hypothetical protein n=1 Tax=unclassified Pseudodesulfovibrio TaxID=2661612 RepID=UPI000FEC17C2|nr:MULTISPECIES: hypothetical protein [unclassified Pseudodesulfovibrio]MCJ2164686.1 hypothetical protein [Pseudodesulfovibrio sp. S3-i]RWU04122.1 hypothetical protein DWB63_08945 [Pseudodesulfovibrio sp. S3]
MQSQSYRWLSFRSQRSLEEIGNAILLHKFSNSEDQGFTLYELNKNVIEAKFTEKIHMIESVVDYNGNITTIPIETFVHTTFQIRNDYGFIEIYDPPRKLLGLINHLGKITNYETEIAQQLMNIPRLITYFENIGIRIRVRIIKCKDISLSNDTQAEMIIKSSSDVRNNAKDYFQKYTIASATISFVDISSTAKLIASNSGHIKIVDCKSLVKRDLLREAVVAAI